jgi:hypothetical protein
MKLMPAISQRIDRSAKLAARGDSNYWYGRAAVAIKPVSAHSLSKTGIFAENAGDFR